MSPGRCRSYLWITLLAAAVAGLPDFSAAQPAAPAKSQRVVVVNPIETVRSLISRGDYRAAATILDALDQAGEQAEAYADHNETAFLRGLIAYGEGRYDDAVEIFENLLAGDPSLPRVRLELGRAYFAMRRDRLATRQFELAIADDIGNAAINNAETFLRQIENRKTLRTRFSFAIVPDSNVNQATASETVDIFGLPFTLNEEARETSGIGAFATGGVEWRPMISARIRGSVGGQLQHTEFGGREFDDTIASAWVGPEVNLDNKYLTLAATGFRRWFGHQGFNAGVGGRAALFMRPGKRWQLSGNVQVQAIDFDLEPARDGILLAVQLGTKYTIDTQSQISALVGVNRDFAKTDVWRSRTWRIGVGYYRELPLALIADLRADFSRRTFDRQNIAFGARRDDKILELGVQIIKRDIRVFGLSPMISYLLQRNFSNIALYDFVRHRAQFGFIRRF